MFVASDRFIFDRHCSLAVFFSTADPGAPTSKKTLGCSGIIARKKFARSSVEATQSYLAAAFAATARQSKLPQWLRKTKGQVASPALLKNNRAAI